MQADSDTESDSGEENSAVPTERSTGASQLFYTTSTKGFDYSIPAAIQIIHQSGYNDLAHNTDVRNKVLEAANAIIEFLQVAIEHGDTTNTVLASVSALMEPKFLSILFDHRKVFRRLASRELLPVADSSSMVVCWVDALLVKLAATTNLLAGGSDLKLTHVSTFIERQREHDSLAAATQLPVSWLLVASVLDSTYSSPAAKRLSLRLLFGVYMIVPWLVGNDPWKDPHNLPHRELLRILDRHIFQSSSKHGSDFGSLERLTLSMTLSLYAAADIEVSRSETVSPLRPRTLGILLDYLSCILNPEPVGSVDAMPWLSSPIEVLDASQRVLVRWRETVLWCWQKWGDNRIANSEIVTRLTAQWLYHSDSGDVEGATHLGVIEGNKMLESDPKVAAGALSHVLLDLLGAVTYSQSSTQGPRLFLGLISKTIGTLVSLLREHFTNPDFQQSTQLPEIFRCLASLFVLLPEYLGTISVVDVKYDILESMSLVDLTIVKHVLPLLCKSPKFAFADKIDDLMFKTGRCLTEQSTNTLQTANHKLVGLNLDFISFIWYHTGKGFLHRQALEMFISSLLEFFQDGTNESLLTSVTTCFTVLDNHPSCVVSSSRSAHFWKACVSTPSSDLGTAASFAYHVVHSDTLPSDLLCVQAFDRLRGTLALTLKRDFVDKQEPVALSLSNLLCAGMLRLITKAATPAVTFMILSPWTKSFSVNLRTLLRDDSPGISYTGILRKRLDLLGSDLLDAIEAMPEDDALLNKQDVPSVACRLIMCQTYNLPTLVFIPE